MPAQTLWRRDPDLKGYIGYLVGRRSGVFHYRTLVINNDGEPRYLCEPYFVTFSGRLGFSPIEIVYFESFTVPGVLGLAGSTFTGTSSCVLCESEVRRPLGLC